MRIGIDYTAAVRQGAGIGRYTRELVRALIQRAPAHDYTLIVAGKGVSDPPSALDGLAGRAHVRVVWLPVTDHMLAVLWHRLRLPFWVELVAGRLDLFYSPDFTLPPVLAARTVVTVHDLSFVRLSECSEPGLSKYLLEAVPRSARRADLILVDSHCTGADARELLQLPPQRVQVLYPGVDSRFRPIRDADTLESLRTRLSLPPQFILAVGTLQPRKNYRRLLEAFAALRTGMEGLALVIAGAKGWLYEGIFHRVEELGLQDDVRFLGHVPDSDLPALYSLAQLLAFPSLYEGFGLPPLEAMACGTPVVTSNASSLTEVVGEAALLVDPLDSGALDQAMRRVLSEPALREALVQRGLARAAGFTWEDSARRLAQLLERVAAGTIDQA